MEPKSFLVYRKVNEHDRIPVGYVHTERTKHQAVIAMQNTLVGQRHLKERPEQKWEAEETKKLSVVEISLGNMIENERRSSEHELEWHNKQLEKIMAELLRKKDGISNLEEVIDVIHDFMIKGAAS